VIETGNKIKTSAGVLRIEGLGYFDPDIVTFYGSDSSGGKTQLVQHVSQLNVMLRALPKPGEQALAFIWRRNCKKPDLWGIPGRDMALEIKYSLLNKNLSSMRNKWPIIHMAK